MSTFHRSHPAAWLRPWGSTGLPPFVAALALAAPVLAQGDGQVRFQGSDYPLAALPATAPAAVRQLLGYYAPLVMQLKLRGWLDAAGNCGLLYTRAMHSAPALQAAVDKTNELFAGAWGSKQDPEPYLVIVLERQKDVGKVIDHLLPKYPYLTDWAKSARKQAGFNLYSPPLYVVVDDTGPKSEFRLVNQVVHQQTLLILYREFRRLPFWVHEGLAWVAEEDLTGRMHAFNHRVGFVAVTEHTDWRANVRRLAHDKPDWKRVLATDPTRYDQELSLLAYGFGCFLLRQEDHGKKALAALGDAWWRKTREGKQPDVELSPEEQDAVLGEVLGAEYEQAILDFLRSDARR